MWASSPPGKAPATPLRVTWLKVAPNMADPNSIKDSVALIGDFTLIHKALHIQSLELIAIPLFCTTEIVSFLHR